MKPPTTSALPGWLATSTAVPPDMAVALVGISFLSPKLVLRVPLPAAFAAGCAHMGQEWRRDVPAPGVTASG